MAQGRRDSADDRQAFLNSFGDATSGKTKGKPACMSLLRSHDTVENRSKGPQGAKLCPWLQQQAPATLTHEKNHSIAMNNLKAKTNFQVRWGGIYVARAAEPEPEEEEDGPEPVTSEPTKKLHEAARLGSLAKCKHALAAGAR